MAATFPLLSSGAVTQYPAKMSTTQSVNVIRFLDGSDQRFLNVGKQYRRWQIQLQLLSNEEIAAIEDFFGAQKGIYSSFVFTDPFSDTQIPNCRMASPELLTEYSSVNSNLTTLWVIETNG